jgi:chitodextrinase
MLGNAIGIGIPFTIGTSFRGRSGSSSVTTTGTTISFSTVLPSTDYSVFIRCFDGSGNNIDYMLTEKAVTGFKITSAIDGTAEYIVVFGESSSIRFASESVVTTGTAITLSSVLAGLGYGALIRCFDGSGNTIDTGLTSKAVSGFTLASVINATAEYIAILGNTSSIKTGSEAVTTGGTVIAFDSALSTTSYAVGIRCFNGSGDNVDYALTNKTKNGFTITPVINSTVEYIAINYN